MCVFHVLTIPKTIAIALCFGNDLGFRVFQLVTDDIIIQMFIYYNGTVSQYVANKKIKHLKLPMFQSRKRGFIACILIFSDTTEKSCIYLIIYLKHTNILWFRGRLFKGGLALTLG